MMKTSRKIRIKRRQPKLNIIQFYQNRNVCNEAVFFVKNVLSGLWFSVTIDSDAVGGIEAKVMPRDEPPEKTITKSL